MMGQSGWILRRGLVTGLALAAMAAAMGGCKSNRAFWNGFLDPTQVGGFDSPKRTEIRTTLGILEPSPTMENAVEPGAEDLVVDYSEPVISPGDVIVISIMDLFQMGQTADFQLLVSNSGVETLTGIGRVMVAGYTARELELELQRKLVEDGVIVDDPEVRVIIGSSQAQTYQVVGYVSRPGLFPIPRPDYRLLDAVASMGGLPDSVDRIYILRKGAATATGKGDAGTSTESARPPESPTEVYPGNDGFEPISFTMTDSSMGRAGVQPEPATSRVGGDEPPIEEMDELEFLDRPTTSAPTPYFDAATGTWREGPPATQPPMTGDSGADVGEVPSTAAAPSATQPDAGDAAATAPAEPGAPIGDETGDEPATTQPPASPGEPMTPTTLPRDAVEDSAPGRPSDAIEPPTRPAQGVAESRPGTELKESMRILEIPVRELMAGDPRYNVVVRSMDLIKVEPDAVGPYYMMGHVNRPGAYGFSGRPLTVKEAIASAGGFDLLAWPSRADLTRRVSRYEEQTIQLDLDAIFAGTAPDVYLRPNDMLNVGTHPVATFLAVLRNSFRMSYGLGFVYDRNYADEDSFSAKEQTRQRRQAERAARGLPI